MFQTGEPLAIAANHAIVSGAVFDVGEKSLIQYGHCWSEEQSPTPGVHPSTEFGNKNEGGGYSSLLTGLQPETRYFMRSYVTANTGEVSYGDQVEFHTPPKKYDLFMPTTSEAVAIFSENNMVIDGVANEPEWGMTDMYTCEGKLDKEVDVFSSEDLSCNFKILYNDEGIMVWIMVKDEKIITFEDVRDLAVPTRFSEFMSRVDTWMADYAEIYLHWGDYPTPSGEYTVDNSFQIRFNPWYSSSTISTDPASYGGRNGLDNRPLEEMFSFVDFIVVPAEGGYNVEAFISWDLFAHRPGNLVYFEIMASDADNLEILRESMLSWNNTDRHPEDAWQNINQFGRLLLYNPNF